MIAFGRSIRPAASAARHGRQPGDRGGQADQPVRRPAGQRQGRGDLITDVIARPPVTGRAGVRGPPGTQPGHRGQLQRGGPRRQPPGRGQHPDQLIIAEHGQPVIPRIAGEGGQRRAGLQLIELPPGGEPPRAGHMIAMGEPGGQDLPRGSRGRCVIQVFIADRRGHVSEPPVLAFRRPGVRVEERHRVERLPVIVRVRGPGPGGGRDSWRHGRRHRLFRASVLLPLALLAKCSSNKLSTPTDKTSPVRHGTGN